MLRPWRLNIEIDRDSDTAIYLQIAQRIIEEIQRGRLMPGVVLPGTRELSVRLNVNRKTVVLAYEELVAQGWLSTEGKRGTFVSPEIPVFDGLFSGSGAAKKPVPATRYKLYGDALPSEDHVSRNTMIDFGDGVPDTRLIPFEIISRAFRHALIISARANRLGYGDPRGSLTLRQAIVKMVNMERGLCVDIDNICIVRGSQMGIFLAARLLVKPGDGVVLENLSYSPAREAFKSCGAKIFNVSQDSQGMCLDELEQVCRHHRVRAVYVTPHHQFPTTVMMSADRRLKLLMLAERYDFAIVEDDYDHEFHFSHHPVLPLASLDRLGRVIYVGSLSKVLAPGMRVGYLIAPANVIDRCASEIMLIDRQGNVVAELAAAELLESGEIRRHVRRTLKVYDERRTVLAELIRTEIGPVAKFELPDGGLAIWLRLDARLDMRRLIGDMRIEQVRALPGSHFSENGHDIHAIRLGYGNLDLNELHGGMQKLKRAFSRQSSRVS